MLDKQLKLKARIEKVIGHKIYVWRPNEKSVIFRISDDVSLQTITAISNELGTDKINFNFGFSGTPRYSEYTPGDDGEPGYIQIFLDGIKDEEEEK
jgi:hypothetical protein